MIVELPAAAVAARARCCGDPDGCVLCEVDGLPLDPVLFLERQIAQAEARGRLEQLQAQLSRPRPVPVDPPRRMTARERGRARAAAAFAWGGEQQLPEGELVVVDGVIVAGNLHGVRNGRRKGGSQIRIAERERGTPAGASRLTTPQRVPELPSGGGMV